MPEENKTIDTTQAPEAAPQEGEPKTVKREGVLSGIKNIVSEKEFKNSPAALRLLVEEKYKLEGEVKDLESFRGKYYDKKEEASVLKEKLNALNIKLILTTLGGILAGFLPTIWAQWNNIAILLAAGVVAFAFLLVGFFKKIE